MSWLTDGKCPQCDKPIEPQIMGKDSKWGGIYIRCPECGWKSDTWATEAQAWADWEKKT